MYGNLLFKFFFEKLQVALLLFLFSRFLRRLKCRRRKKISKVKRKATLPAAVTREAPCWLVVLTCLLSTGKNWVGVSKGRKLLDWLSKRDLGLYNFPFFSSAAASSERWKGVFVLYPTTVRLRNTILMSWMEDVVIAPRHIVQFIGEALNGENFAPFVAFAIPPRTKALTLPSPPPSKAARNSS